MCSQHGRSASGWREYRGSHPRVMADFPLLRLPRPVVDTPPAGRGNPPRQPRGPGRRRQQERLGPVFDRLADVFDGNRDPVTLRDDPGGLAPERVLVFEVAGSIGDFAAATNRIPGLEYLAEQSTEFPPDYDFWIEDTRKGRTGQPRQDRSVGGCLYMAMPDFRGLRQLLRLWQRYQNGEDPRHGFGRWFRLFEQLRDLRPWGPKDRIPPDVAEDFRQALASDPREVVPVELELWVISNVRRRLAREKVSEIIVQAGGSVLHSASIPEIAYEAILADLPREEIVRLIDYEEVMGQENIDLALCDDIMFVRPQSLPGYHWRTRESAANRAAVGPLPAPGTAPVAALLDGIPVQRHHLLDGRIVVDDPDELEGQSVVSDRIHGTAMASLILHGDVKRRESPLSRPLHIHPVLYAPGNGEPERFHPRRLLIDTIYRAVLRMKDGDGGSSATAPEVFLVNLSLGDMRRPYAGQISPWARLLDYLAHRYGILFLVSAGNILNPLPVPEHTSTTFEDASTGDRQTAVLRGLERERSYRTLLSPAEALNVVTVGARHDEDGDGDARSGALLLDPYESTSLPNVSSAMGLGHRRTVKPDILMPGGREKVIPLPEAGRLTIKPAQPGRAFGIDAAAPDPGGSLDHVGRQGGTSTATALATRSAHRIFDALMDTHNGAILSDADPRYYAAVVRALLLHRAEWDAAVGTELAELYGPHGQGMHVARDDNVARVLGYGVPRLDQAMTCSAERATLIGYGDIHSGRTATCRVPLPPCLAGVETPRAITITLAWFSPVNVRNLAYRMAKLEVKREFTDKLVSGRTRLQPSHATIPRGTVFHERYEGHRMVEFVDGEHLSLRITCREQAGKLDDPIRYGLAVTIEAGERIPVYQQIRDRLAVRART